MRRISRFVVRGTLAGVLLLGAVVAEGSVVPAPDDVAGRPHPTFKIRGRITGLVPGARVPLRVQVANRYAFPIVVTTVGAVVSSRVPACPSRALSIRPWRGSRRVPADRAGRITLLVMLRRTAPIDCAGMRFHLHYTGRAVKAGPR